MNIPKQVRTQPRIKALHVASCQSRLPTKEALCPTERDSVGFDPAHAIRTLETCPFATTLPHVPVWWVSSIVVQFFPLLTGHDVLSACQRRGRGQNGGTEKVKVSRNGDFFADSYCPRSRPGKKSPHSTHDQNSACGMLPTPPANVWGCLLTQEVTSTSCCTRNSIPLGMPFGHDVDQGTRHVLVKFGDWQNKTPPVAWL